MLAATCHDVFMAYAGEAVEARGSAREEVQACSCLGLAGSASGVANRATMIAVIADRLVDRDLRLASTAWLERWELLAWLWSGWLDFGVERDQSDDNTVIVCYTLLRQLYA